MMETLYFGIQEIFKEKLFCDVQLCFKQGSVIDLHKIILASSSSFLLECLASQTSEETTCIILPDFNLHEFRYSNSVQFQINYNMYYPYVFLFPVRSCHICMEQQIRMILMSQMSLFKP